MGATLVLIGVIAMLVHGSRKRTVEYLVTLTMEDRDETLTFNVRDMTASVGRRTASAQHANHELRRAGGRWETAERPEVDEPLHWLACDRAASAALEEAYLRYTGEEPVASRARTPYRDS